jgi:hypothetical protein
MFGEAAGRPGSEQEFDPCEILRATVEALGRMDLAALEALSAQAAALASLRVRLKQANAREAVSLKEALGELLRSTERSLRMLRGLHEARVRRIEEATTWER